MMELLLDTCEADKRCSAACSNVGDEEAGTAHRVSHFSVVGT